jgi:sulfoxide reductase heme-binding subunit YedZ
MLNQFGMVALICLICSLACTPLKLMFGWTWPMRVRKMLGLISFFYVCLHFMVYFFWTNNMDLRTILADITKRPFIIIGFCAFLILIPLAATSTNKMIAKLGAARWQMLHRLAYVAAILGAIHFYMRVKLDVTEPLIYAGILALLLGIRLIFRFKNRPSAASPG